jgi:hypothetical protein
MEEISSFIEASLSSVPSLDTKNASKVAETYQGIANVFQRIADDIKAGERNNVTSGQVISGGPEVDGLLDFAEKGKIAVAQVKDRRG